MQHDINSHRCCDPTLVYNTVASGYNLSRSCRCPLVQCHRHASILSKQINPSEDTTTCQNFNNMVQYNIPSSIPTSQWGVGDALAVPTLHRQTCSYNNPILIYPYYIRCEMMQYMNMSRYIKYDTNILCIYKHLLNMYYIYQYVLYLVRMYWYIN